MSCDPIIIETTNKSHNSSGSTQKLHERTHHRAVLPPISGSGIVTCAPRAKIAICASPSRVASPWARSIHAQSALDAAHSMFDFPAARTHHNLFWPVNMVHSLRKFNTLVVCQQETAERCGIFDAIEKRASRPGDSTICGTGNTLRLLSGDKFSTLRLLLFFLLCVLKTN